ncbi:glycosyl hydrolase [Paenibacillus sp. MBLB4367]|uniref:glycosyl hydrolase n=1 Tax=Paenibacillus sp. MBLB4367 TaxID=3384767 RepID=UPI0039083772
MSALNERFRNPGAEYRSSPFWAWNGRLDSAELIRQAREMKAQGMGGFFMHSREGLETEYMGEEWMNNVAGLVSEARELGIKAWLYDEDRFPSGGAGGQVPRMGGDAFRAKAVTLEIADFLQIESDDRLLALFRAQLRGHAVVGLERVKEERASQADVQSARETEPDVRAVWLLLRREVSTGTEWFNGEAPVDNLNPDAVAAFIDVTYEAYREKVGAEFGRTIPGIFTDEPSIADFHCSYPNGRPWLPWTDGFEEMFRERRGYDLIERLPYLFLDGELASKTRHDYWRSITERFSDAYARQLGEWCGRNGLAFTGHFLIEHNLGISTRVSGAVMPHYRYQQIPGIDILDEKTEEWLTVKQCTSVASQYRRKHVMSEMYGCCGWDFTFEGQKWLGDWQFVMGVTMRCQHLSLYSLNGCRKRDFPPVFSDVSPWWKYNHAIEDYFARLSAVLCDGIPVRDVLLIHPATTIWTRVGSDPERYLQWEDPSLLAVNVYEAELVRTIKTLLGQHIDFDFGDEIILSEDGAVREGQLVVKHAAYRVVVLPMLNNVLRTTFELLLRFAEDGGQIVAIGEVPGLIDGELSGDWQAMQRHPGFHLVSDAREAVEWLERYCPRRVSLRNEYGLEAPQLLGMLREHEDGYTLFVVNNDRLTGVEAEVRLNVTGAVEEWDPFSGEMSEKAVKTESGSIRFVDRWGAAGSKLYRIRTDGTPLAAESRFTYRMAHEMDTASWTFPVKSAFTRTMPNALLLDVCSYRVNGGEWSEPMQVWQAQKEIRTRFGMRDIHYNGQQQRFRWADIPHPGDGAEVDWRVEYEVGEVLEGDLFFVLEYAERFRATWNGKTIPVRSEGSYIDRDWQRIRLPRHSAGRQELILTALYRNRDEMENMFVIGDFAVDASRKIVREPAELAVGNWTLQGYPHYPGNMVYHYTFDASGKVETASLKQACKLRLGTWKGVCAEVRVNGSPAGLIPWEDADGLDIAGGLVKGVNGIDVEIAGSLRNLLGPFHQSGQHNPWMDWSFFQREDARGESGYRLMPYGIMEQPRLYY